MTGVGYMRCEKCGVLFRAAPGECSCGGRRVPEIPQMPQRQDPLDDQLRTVRAAANRLGCYDAADFIGRHLAAIPNAARVDARGTL